MASGNTLLTLFPLQGEPPASNMATIAFRNNHPVLQFDAATDETIYYTQFMPRHYGGGGLTVTLVWAATSAITGAVRWQVALERIDNAGQDIDADGFAAAQSAGGTANGTSGISTYTTIAFTNGAQMDSVAAGDLFRISITRDADGTSGTDDMSGDAELLGVEIRET